MIQNEKSADDNLDIDNLGDDADASSIQVTSHEAQNSSIQVTSHVKETQISARSLNHKLIQNEKSADDNLDIDNLGIMDVNNDIVVKRDKDVNLDILDVNLDVSTEETSPSNQLDNLGIATFNNQFIALEKKSEES